MPLNVPGGGLFGEGIFGRRLIGRGADGNILTNTGSVSSEDSDYYYDTFEDPPNGLDNIRRWNKTITGTGSVTVGSGTAVLATGTTAGSTAIIKHKLGKGVLLNNKILASIRAQVNLTGAADGEFEIGVIDSAENKWLKWIHDDADAIGRTRHARNDGLGEDTDTHDIAFNGVDVTWQIQYETDKSADFTSSVDAVTTQYTLDAFVGDDLHLYIKIKNTAASNQTISIDWVNLKTIE
jgi:hypothetical protein